MPALEQACLVCFTVFVPKTQWQKFCSAECRKANHNLGLCPNCGTKKTCPQCGVIHESSA